MNKSHAVAAGVLSVGIAVGALLSAGPASAAGSWVCAPVVRSSDGHTAAGSCYSGPGTKFALRATACSTSGCVTLTSSYVAYKATAYLNAGGGYIDQNTFSYVHN